MNILGLAALGLGLLASPANAGGVLLCGPYGCRSSPYFPPPIFMVRPPVVSTRPPIVEVYPQTVWPQRAYEPRRGSPPPQVAQQAPPRSRPDVAVPPPDAEDTTAAQADIEQGILDFCDQNPDEQFCTKLGAFLRKHPDRRSK